MTNFDTPWYELAETLSGKELEKLVKSDNFVSCASVDEIANVTIECKIPMVKMIYQITDREKNVVKEGEYAFNKDGVNKFVIKDVVDLTKFATLHHPGNTWRTDTGRVRGSIQPPKPSPSHTARVFHRCTVQPLWAKAQS